MAKPEKKSFNTPDERRTPPKAEMSFVKFGDRVFVRSINYPGFRWTVDMKPVAGTDLCQVAHFALVISGRCHVALADGTEFEVGPGDIVTVPAGHDMWVVGDEPYVSYDFSGAVRPE